MRQLLAFGTFITFTICLISCGDGQGSQEEVSSPKTTESLIKTNRYLVRSENEDIQNYINRHGLKMIETGSGLRYSIDDSEGEGSKALRGQWVELNYQLSLITGDILYSSKESGPMSFKIGKGGVESGLEEAILHLRKGDKAKLIIPSHLAHGLLGDDNKIPARSTVIYDIEIVNLK